MSLYVQPLPKPTLISFAERWNEVYSKEPMPMSYDDEAKYLVELGLEIFYRAVKPIFNKDTQYLIDDTTVIFDHARNAYILPWTVVTRDTTEQSIFDGATIASVGDYDNILRRILSGTLDASNGMYISNDIHSMTFIMAPIPALVGINTSTIITIPSHTHILDITGVVQLQNGAVCSLGASIGAGKSVGVENNGTTVTLFGENVAWQSSGYIAVRYI